MSAGIPFQSFLLRHQYTPERAFLSELPLGCLLDSASPTRALQSGSFVFPLTKRDAQPSGTTISIGSGPGHDPADVARGRVVVGADPQRCDVVLSGATIAPVHAYFFVRRARLHVADCGAPHGTFVAGQQLRAMQRVPLRTDAITEVWFGEEGFFHFDAKSLYSYIHYLLGTHEARPALRSDMAREAPAAEPPPPLAATENEVAPPDPWAGGVGALRRLGGSLRVVRVVLERVPEPVTVYDADARQDLEASLQTLEGLRPLVAQVQAHLRRSRLELTVFRRAEGACSR